MVEGWDRFHGGRGLDALEARLVRQIRQWRPEIIVTQGDRGGDAGGGDAAGQVLGQAVAAAIGKAADPRAFPAESQLAGLEPWQVKKAYGLLPPAARGQIELMTAQFAPRLGRSLADAAAPARGLLEDRFQAPAAMLSFRPLAEALPAGEGGDFVAGTAPAPGGDARRQIVPVSAEGSETLERMAQRRRHTQAILQQADRDPQAALRLLAQAGDLTRGLDAASAAGIVYRLADRYAMTGHGDLAAETFQLLVDQYPDDPLCRPALVWLLQYYASGEAAQRARRSTADGGRPRR